MSKKDMFAEFAAENPMFDEAAPQVTAGESVPTKSNKKAKRALLLAGVLAVAGGAFAAGFLAAAPSATLSGDELTGSSLASTLVSGRDSNGRTTYNRRKTIRAINTLVKNDEALQKSPALSDAGLMTQAVAVYKLTGQIIPAGLTEDFLKLMSAVAPEVPEALKDQILQGGGRRLGADVHQKSITKPNLQQYSNLVVDLVRDRQLAATSLEFVNQVFTFVALDSRTMTHQVSFVHPNTATDSFGIQLVGEDCYIVARETDEDADWENNAKTGIVDVMNINNDGSAISAIASFGEAYNEMRVELWNTIDSECVAKGAKKYNFGGWSRGGALASIASASLFKQRLLPRQNIRLMTFGAPRAVFKWDALRVDRKFEQYRLVYKTDFVAAVPPTWEDVAHFGTLVSKEGNFPLGTDEPFFNYAQADFADHGGYFRDWLPETSWETGRGHQAV